MREEEGRAKEGLRWSDGKHLFGGRNAKIRIGCVPASCQALNGPLRSPGVAPPCPGSTLALLRDPGSGLREGVEANSGGPWQWGFSGAFLDPSRACLSQGRKSQ